MSLPNPVAASVGLAASGLDLARKLPERVAGATVRLVMSAVTAPERVRRTYDELAERGQGVLGHEPEPQLLPEPIVTGTPGATLEHADLPLEDFDHLTLGQVRSRIRSLDGESVIQLLDYERVHADRLPVITLLETQIAKLT